MRVVDEAKVFVAHVGGLDPIVPLNGFLGTFVACFVVLTSVRLDSSIGRCNQMQDCIISIVSHHNLIHAEVVHQGLPFLRAYVRLPIHQSAVNQDYNLLVVYHLSNLQEAFLEGDLHLD